MSERHSEWTEIRIRWTDWDAMQGVVDAARAHVNDPEVDLPDDWNVPHTPTFAALLDAVRALDSGEPAATPAGCVCRADFQRCDPELCELDSPPVATPAEPEEAGNG